jgi:hypothetical protein
MISEEKFTPQALKLWRKIPEWAQEKLLSNVFCSHCVAMTTIVESTGQVVGGDLVLKGQCQTCGGEVARVIESE